MFNPFQKIWYRYYNPISIHVTKNELFSIITCKYNICISYKLLYLHFFIFFTFIDIKYLKLKNESESVHSRNNLSRFIRNWNHPNCISKLRDVPKHVLCWKRSMSRPNHHTYFYYENFICRLLDFYFKRTLQLWIQSACLVSATSPFYFVLRDDFDGWDSFK